MQRNLERNPFQKRTTDNTDDTDQKKDKNLAVQARILFLIRVIRVIRGESTRYATFKIARAANIAGTLGVPFRKRETLTA